MIKAGYIEKFTQFIQWPDSDSGNLPDELFVIAVIGENNISKALADIFLKSKTKGVKYSVEPIKTIEQIETCKILFIPSSEKTNLDKILAYTSGKPILTIGDTKGFGEKGVIINMFQEGNFIRYEVNRKWLTRSGLSINSLLLNYAVIIE
jgi:hypothetical protein